MAMLYIPRCLNHGLRYLLLQQRSFSAQPIHQFNEDDIKEKLHQFPGGSIDLQKEDGVATLIINHPERLNAFTGTMILELRDRVEELEHWSNGKGLILRGADNTFCSGSDLNMVRAISSPKDGTSMCMFMQNTLTRLQRLPLISVALVQGFALGGGAELITACDFRLVTSESEIRFVHKVMGLVPGWGGATRLVQIVGYRRALKLLSGADHVGSAKALRIGLADKILPSSDHSWCLEESQKWLRHYIKGSSSIIQAIKNVVVSGRELPLEEALRNEKYIFSTMWGSPDNLKALSAILKHKKH